MKKSKIIFISFVILLFSLVLIGSENDENSSGLMIAFRSRNICFNTYVNFCINAII